MFEDAFASYCGARFAVAVASGTDALHLALRASGIGSGDEVITVANTCVPTVVGITMSGALPVFVDIRADTLNMDPAQVESAITPRTKAILPVHLYGRPVEMSAILELARQYSLRVIEDCAQAHGARYGGKKVGALGDAGCFSFYPTKNLGAFGDGGIVVTNDEQIAKLVRMLRSYGETERYHHEIEGFNSRLDELQAAFLLAKLPFLDSWNSRRREIASIYENALSDLDLVCPRDRAGGESVFHLFIVRVKQRARFRDRMRDQGVETLVHYPSPIPSQPAYAAFASQMSNLPETALACGEVVSLPLFPEMTPDEVERVIAACREAL